MAEPPESTFQKSSPSYRLPALDETFLLGESMRGVRFLLEYSKAMENPPCLEHPLHHRRVR